MQIEYSKAAGKYISTLDKPTKKRLKKKIEGLTETPPKGDIKPLQGYIKGTMRLRDGKIRVIYRYTIDSNQQKMLYISAIDSRGDIYK